MMQLEYFPVGVNVRILSRPASDLDPEDGEWIHEADAHNLVVTEGKILVARMLSEDSGFDTGITFAEVGTDNTAPTVADTALGAVTKRNAITKYLRAANVVQFRTFFAAADITATLEEVALWGHSTASASTGTGELFNRALVSFDNSSGAKDLTMVVEVTFG